MDKPKPGLPTAEIKEMTLPIIADLGDGWFLVAHPNGAAIATATRLAVLWESEVKIPEPIRERAVRAFEEFAWPLVRGEFYPTD